MRIILIILTTSFFSQMAVSVELDLKKEEIKWYKHAKSMSLCKDEESLIFTCKIRSKTASVCAGKSPSSNSDYLQYRFGMKGNIEVEIPSSTNTDQSSVAFKNEIGASWYAYYYRFKSGSYKYYLYAASVRRANDPETGASTREEPFGLVVMKDNQKILSRKCIEAFEPERRNGDPLWTKYLKKHEIHNDISAIELAFPPTP